MKRRFRVTYEIDVDNPPLCFELSRVKTALKIAEIYADTPRIEIVSVVTEEIPATKPS